VKTIEEAKKNISVVIQGPIDDRTYEAIDCYQDFGEVIIATWSENEDYSLLNKCSKDSKYRLATCVYPSVPYKNYGGIFYVATTLLRGALAAKCPYIIKMRSDELYPNLEKFLQNFIQYPDRFHTTDNGFWKRHNYCLSAHFFLEKKENCIHATKAITEYHLGIKYQELKLNIGEMIIGFFFMKLRNPQLNNSNWKQTFRENVWITPCSELPGHLHSGQTSQNRGFKRSTEPYPCGRKEMPNGCHNPAELYRHIEEII